MAGGVYTPVAGDVLTAANAIDFWCKQVVILCTSGTRPSSPRAGMCIFQTDTNTFAIYGTAWCEVTPYGAVVATSQTTTSTSYTDLATSGPAVTVATGTKAIITIGVSDTHSVTNGILFAAYAVSGATTVAAADTAAAQRQVYVNTAVAQYGITLYATGLTAGNNTFTVKYKITVAGTGTWANRNITAVAIPT